MTDNSSDLINDFVVESLEGLAEVESDLLAIEAAGDDLDTDLVNKVFRAVHSIKGASGFLGLGVIGDLSHNLENVLSLLRNGELTPTSDRVEVMLAAADELQSLIESVDSSNEVDVTSHTAALKKIIDGEAEAEPVAEQQPNTDVVQPPGESTEASVETKHTFRLTFDTKADDEIRRDPADFLQRLQDMGQIQDCSVDMNALTEQSIDVPDKLTITIETILEEVTLQTFLQLPDDGIEEVTTDRAIQSDAPEPAPVAVVAPVMESPVIVEPVSPTPSSTSTPATPSPASETKKSARPAVESSIRVPVNVLNRLMNLAGELVLGRNQLLQTVGTNDSRALDSVATRISQVTSELQEAVMQTRLQPIGNVFNKFNRIVRDLSSKLGKQCQLTVEGQDVELDKTIIEAIGDPLTHLIRNSVDHGIELPEQREAAGKKVVGSIGLNAFHQEGKVNIVIQDDGKGIDANMLRRKAVEKGIMTEKQAAQLSEQEAVKLIFHPGFSTAEKISDVSGRGVGMDVVRTNFEKLGGIIDVDTIVGKGTTITIRLPLTLAIIPSLIISAGQNRFAIPQDSIAELVRVREDEYDSRVETVQGAELLRLRGSLLPLARLPKAEGAETDESDSRNLNVIVVTTGTMQFGLVVDELHDTEEIVVKPLGRHVKNVRWLAGATILGDGKVALILDVAGLAANQKISIPESAAKNDDQTATVADEHIDVLLLNNHPEEQFAVPMHLVSRIEQIQTGQIENLADQEVLQYRGGTLPLISLEKHIKAKPRHESERLFVVVCSIGEKEVGLIAPTIHDTCKLSSNLDMSTFNDTGILGSTIVGGQTTRLLEISELAKKAYPKSFANSTPVKHGENDEKIIVLAEDSGFFRSKLKQFMEEEGWTVEDFADGQAAWEFIQSGEEPIDLVLTDIEMPHMNGFDLCANIRSLAGKDHLPIIAVTSLADDESMARSKRVGMTRHLVKLDREQLVSTLSEYLRPKGRKRQTTGSFDYSMQYAMN